MNNNTINSNKLDKALNTKNEAWAALAKLVELDTTLVILENIKEDKNNG